MRPAQSHYFHFVIVATYKKCFEAAKTIVLGRCKQLARLAGIFGEDPACTPRNHPQKSSPGILAVANWL